MQCVDGLTQWGINLTQPCNVNTHSRAHCSPIAHSVYAPSQQGMALQCNAISHWLGAYLTRLCEQWGHGCVQVPGCVEGHPCNSTVMCHFFARTSEETMTFTFHQMETFSALLALCARNTPVTGEGQWRGALIVRGPDMPLVHHPHNYTF